MKSSTNHVFTGALALVVALSVVQAGPASDTPKGESVFTLEQQNFQTRLNNQAQAFLEKNPAYKSLDFSDRESLDRRQEMAREWQEQFRSLLGKNYTPAAGEDTPAKQGEENLWPKETGTRPDTKPQASSRLPNDIVSLPGPPDDVNASIALHGITPGEAYGVWTEFLGPPGFAPSLVWSGGTPAVGSGAPWAPFGPIPPGFAPEAWNPTIAYNAPLFPTAFYETHIEYALPALAPSPSFVVVNPSFGGGAPFPTGPTALVWPAPGPGIWEDYPYIVADNHPGNPAGPGGSGDIHVAWIEYIDGDGDPDGSLNFFDDPADGYVVAAASSNSGVGPFPYPVFSPPFFLFGGPVQVGAHQAHRPSLSVVGPSGTPAMPPAGVYIAWLDIALGAVMVDANPFPGLGAPWINLGPVPAAPVAFLPPVLAPGIKASSSVSIAVDNGPLFPGLVYIAWSDYATGDADIMFSSSVNGGLFWSAPARVNQEPVGNGIDQWAPHMVVDATTGRICITYYDRRNDPANVAIETWASESFDGGLTWTDNLVSVAGPIPPTGGMPLPTSLYIGDYLGSSADHGFGANGWASIWNDGRAGPNQDVFAEVVKQPDCDADGIPDAVDNCPAVYNPNQAITITLTGDVNLTGVITSADIIYMVNYVFKGGPAPLPCPASGDVNCDGSVNSSDIIYVVNHVFKSGPPPCNVCLATAICGIWSCP